MDKPKRKKLIKDILGWVVYLAFLAGLVWATPKLLSRFLNTPYPIAAITSSSMWPALKKGDLVFIKGIENKEEIQKDDIVVYDNAQGFTIHRVVSLDENRLITKGDANNTTDQPISYSKIVGKTLSFNNKVLRIPALGNVSIFLSKR